MPSEIFTIQEVAEFLRLNPKTAYRLAASGELPGFKVGGSWRFRRDAIEKFTKKTVVTDRATPTRRGGKT